METDSDSEEIKLVEIKVPGRDLTDLIELELSPLPYNCSYLNCSNNKLTVLPDLGDNLYLEGLKCDINQL